MTRSTVQQVKGIRPCCSLLAALLAVSVGIEVDAAAIPAFPGADGAGATVTGGRGGIVYHVTKLDSSMSDNGPGTFRYGVNDANFTVDGVVTPRTIVFDVGGSIFLGLSPTHTSGWDAQSPISVGSHITIAGQTAPGGINIVGSGLKANKTNEIFRNLLIAPGYGIRSVNSTTGYADQYTFDAMNIAASGVMVDHVSAFFTTDESISADERANNVTVQYSNISQGQNYPQLDTNGTYTGHAFGSLLQEGSNAAISVIHNLYAHQKGRLPRVGTPTDKLTVAGVGPIHDFRNNVFYNWKDTAGTGNSSQFSANNFIGNYYLAGNGGDDVSGTNIVQTAGGTNAFDGSSSAVTQAYVFGNLKDVDKNNNPYQGVAMTASSSSSSSIDFRRVTVASTPFTQVPYYGLTETATAAFDRVLDYVGANWNNRSSIDARIVNEVRTVTGQIMAFNDATHGTEWNALLALRSTANGGIGGTGIYSRPANFDTDLDGMPNEWELQHGLDPNVADNNGDFDNDGYTNLEEYLNDLASFPAPAPLVFANGDGNGRYEQIGNWRIPGQESATQSIWQPSRYDEAQINTGTVTVDSAGQHADIVKIGANSGDSAELNITGGWLRAETAVSIGDHADAAGTLHLSGGALSTAILTKGADDTFLFTGGTLHAGLVTFDVHNEGGTIAPGNSIGTTHVMGNLLNEEDATLDIELVASGSDVLMVDGLLTLDGALDVKVLGWADLYVGKTWLIAMANQIEGDFDYVTDGYVVERQAGNLYLVAQVPEPGTLTLAALGIAAMMIRTIGRRAGRRAMR